MTTRKKRIIAAVAFIVMTLLIAVAAAFFFMSRDASTPAAKERSKSAEAQAAEPAEIKPTYSGQDTLVANTFSIKVPNGWKASIADTGTFRAIMFARPEQLASLVYNADTPPSIDRNGIPAWNGLTEHFFVTIPTVERQFDQADHRTVTSEGFQLDDGTEGTKYFVTKNANEAAQYGGLLRDDHWEGRTYIYEENGARVEAHLALYPSANIDKDFYESVIKTIVVK